MLPLKEFFSRVLNVVNVESFIFKLTRASMCDKPTVGFHQHLYDYICYKIQPLAKIVILLTGNLPATLKIMRLLSLLLSNQYLITICEAFGWTARIVFPNRLIVLK